ncbi:MAG: valine--tRNA ligase [Nanoarchaeota archaeon]
MDPKNYDPQKTESKILGFWKINKIYKFNPKRGKIYSIDTPPPTVSGKMHIGHAFSYSQQDFIARYRRMKENVFYPFGTDDNGLPTERLIERLKNVKSKEMSRNEFVKLCLETIKEITPDFIQDWKNLGISCDYNLYYSTIDKNSIKLSQKSFLELYKKKFIYKKEFPTLWCPECQTAIAQAELEDKKQESLFSTIKFKVNNEDLLIATTRPELLPACVAVFINPRDERYKHFIGKKATVPLFNYKVPIIDDSSADIKKGTGVLMICSYGDKYDVDAINRHKLPPKILLDKDGKLNIKEYGRLKIKEARNRVLEDLRDSGLVAEQKIIINNINVHDKCGTEIEFIPTEQWFIKILDKKNKLINQSKKIDWYPSYMFKRYENWVKGIEWDWSISRDRHFGVPIPVWECKSCNKIILPNENELPVDPLEIKKPCPKCNQQAKPEEKVLDTWATSSLTPQIAIKIASSLLKNNKTAKIEIPYSLRPQAHDLIRTWAFYTIVKSLYHENKIPWNNIMVSGFVTLEGKKMSKSKGNVIEPQEIFKEYGADALRFWAASSKPGEDLDYNEKDLISGKKFITKIWNANRFMFMNLRDYKHNTKSKEQRAKIKLEVIDRLFLIKLNNLIKNCTNSFEKYDYSKAKTEIEKFFWDFCDNYLEIVKKRIYNKTGYKKLSAQYTLYKSLLTILKLIAPIMPFITEEIYQNYFKKTEKEKSIHLTKWPISEKIVEKTEILDLFLDILTKVRQEKSTAKKPMNSEIVLTLPKSEKNKIKPLSEDLKDVTNTKEIKEGGFGVEFV